MMGTQPRQRSPCSAACCACCNQPRQAAHSTHLRLCEWKRADPLVSQMPTLTPRRSPLLPLLWLFTAPLAWLLALLLRPSRPPLSAPLGSAGRVT